MDASNSSDRDGIVSVRWDCEGDGAFESGGDWTVLAQRTHVCTYTEDGFFEPTVRVTNSQASLTTSVGPKKGEPGCEENRSWKQGMTGL